MVIEEPVWREVAKVGNVPASDPLEVGIGHMAFILVRLGDDIAAYQGTCPHQSARLAGGTVIDGWLHCPQHRAMFRLLDGFVVRGGSCQRCGATNYGSRQGRFFCPTRQRP